MFCFVLFCFCFIFCFVLVLFLFCFVFVLFLFCFVLVLFCFVLVYFVNACSLTMWIDRRLNAADDWLHTATRTAAKKCLYDLLFFIIIFFIFKSICCINLIFFVDEWHYWRNFAELCVLWTSVLSKTEAHGQRQNARSFHWTKSCSHAPSQFFFCSLFFAFELIFVSLL